MKNINPDKKLKWIQVRLSHGLHAAVKRICKAQGISISEFVRRAIPKK